MSPTHARVRHLRQLLASLPLGLAVCVCQPPSLGPASHRQEQLDLGIALSTATVSASQPTRDNRLGHCFVQDCGNDPPVNDSLKALPSNCGRPACGRTI